MPPEMGFALAIAVVGLEVLTCGGLSRKSLFAPPDIEYCFKTKRIYVLVYRGHQ